MSARTHQVRAARRATLWLTVCILLAGLIVLIGFFRLADPNQHPFWQEVLYLLATVLISSALISLIVGRASVDQQTLEMRETVERAIDAALTPIRGILQEGSQTDYRWHCIAGAPSADDPWQDYAWQRVEIFKRLQSVPEKLLAVAVSELGESALEQYEGDDRCFLRWVVDVDLPLDNERIFAMGPVRLNGQALVPTTKDTKRGDALIREFWYSVPGPLPESMSGHDLEYSFLTRKHTANDSRVRFRTQVFQHTYGAEFRCTIAPSLRPKTFHANASEVSPLGPDLRQNGALVADVMQPGPWSIVVRFESPIQRGSAVAFHIDRQVSASGSGALDVPALTDSHDGERHADTPFRGPDEGRHAGPESVARE